MTYKKIKVNGSHVHEHRHVVEKALGVKLGPNDVVHHVNGNKLDNRIENLQVLSRAEHSKHHGISSGYHDLLTFKCSICSKAFQRKKGLVTANSLPCCSRSCSAKLGAIRRRLNK